MTCCNSSASTWRTPNSITDSNIWASRRSSFRRLWQIVATWRWPRHWRLDWVAPLSVNRQQSVGSSLYIHLIVLSSTKLILVCRYSRIIIIIFCREADIWFWSGNFGNNILLPMNGSMKVWWRMWWFNVLFCLRFVRRSGDQLPISCFVIANILYFVTRLIHGMNTFQLTLPSHSIVTLLNSSIHLYCLFQWGCTVILRSRWNW